MSKNNSTSNQLSLNASNVNNHFDDQSLEMFIQGFLLFLFFQKKKNNFFVENLEINSQTEIFQKYYDDNFKWHEQVFVLFFGIFSFQKKKNIYCFLRQFLKAFLFFSCQHHQNLKTIMEALQFFSTILHNKLGCKVITILSKKNFFLEIQRIF